MQTQFLKLWEFLKKISFEQRGIGGIPGLIITLSALSSINHYDHFLPT